MQQTYTAAAAELLGIIWDEAWGIRERAVARGLAAKPPLALRRMGVDEKAVGHGQEYATLVHNLEKATVEWVGEGRKKETLAGLWDYKSRGWARKYRARWFFWGTQSRLERMIAVARMVKGHLEGVLNYFAHRITNAVAEWLNSKIATIQKMAYGFRNKSHFRTAVLFRCGGLSLYPRTPDNTG